MPPHRIKRTRALGRSCALAVAVLVFSPLATGAEDAVSGSPATSMGDGGNLSETSSWQAAIDSRDQTVIEDWFESNTGHLAAPDGEPSLWNIGGTVDVTASWLTENDGNGHVWQEDGRWVVDGVAAERIRIQVDNVTVRRCLIRARGAHRYGIQYHNGGPVDTGLTGAIVEYCTLDGGGSEAIGIVLSSSPDAETDTSIVRYTEIFGYRSGSHMLSGTSWRHTYVHDLYYFEGSHNVAGSIRGSNVIVSRNLYDDGGSSVVSLYADDPLDNVLISENVFNTANAHFCVSFPQKKFADVSTDTSLVDNIFGQKYNYNCGWSKAVASIERFSTVSGNTYMDGRIVQ